MNQKGGIWLVVATAIISGFSIFINKYSVSKIEPYTFTFLKNVVVAALLLSVLLFMREFRNLKQIGFNSWLRLVVIGFVGGSIPFLLFFKGLSMTSAAAGSFIHKTMFIYASVLAFIFLKERMNKKILIAAVLLLVGNFLLLKVNSISFGAGALLILIATLFWAFENVLSKAALRTMSGNVVAFGRMFFGSIFILIFLAITRRLSLVMQLSTKDVLWTLITSVLLLLFVMTYYNGLKFLKVSAATSILLLGSPITTLLQFATGAPISLMEVVGMILVFAGVAVAIYFVELNKIANCIREKCPANMQ